MLLAIAALPFFLVGCGRLFDSSEDEEKIDERKNQCNNLARRESENPLVHHCTIASLQPDEELRLLEAGYCRLVCATICEQIPGGGHGNGGVACGRQIRNGTVCYITSTRDLQGNLVQGTEDIQCE